VVFKASAITRYTLLINLGGVGSLAVPALQGLLQQDLDLSLINSFVIDSCSPALSPLKQLFSVTPVIIATSQGRLLQGFCFRQEEA